MKATYKLKTTPTPVYAERSPEQKLREKNLKLYNAANLKTKRGSLNRKQRNMSVK